MSIELTSKVIQIVFPSKSPQSRSLKLGAKTHYRLDQCNVRTCAKKRSTGKLIISLTAHSIVAVSETSCPSGGGPPRCGSLLLLLRACQFSSPLNVKILNTQGELEQL